MVFYRPEYQTIHIEISLREMDQSKGFEKDQNSLYTPFHSDCLRAPTANGAAFGCVARVLNMLSVLI